jgi:Flp pilus assembly secretin CpaC
MIPFSLRRRSFFGPGTVCAAGVLAMLAFVPPAQSAPEVVTVVLDQAKLVKLPDHIATLVIGNPMIADAALQSGGNMVLTGKGYGATNVMALDRTGKILMEKEVLVEAPKDTIIVYRGLERQTYSCTPKCEQQVMLGDSPTAFSATLGQSSARNGQAQAH